MHRYTMAHRDESIGERHSEGEVCSIATEVTAPPPPCVGPQWTLGCDEAHAINHRSYISAALGANHFYEFCSACIIQ